MEQHQVDLYYYFKGSTRRKGILLEYIYFVGLEWDEIARFVPTRWLCLERCCQKETKKFEALVYELTRAANKTAVTKITIKKTPATRFRRLKNDYKDPLTHVYLQFYASALPLVTNFNMFLQRSDPQGHNVQPMVKE